MVQGMTTIGIDTEIKVLYNKAKADRASQIGKQISDNDFMEYLLDHRKRDQK